MMKKRWLTLAALLCAGTVCASVGAAKLADETKVVSAATTTSTWTDNKGTDDTSDDVTYTFEGNVNEDRTNITTTDLGDLAGSKYGMPLATEEGISGDAVTHHYDFTGQANVIALADQAWTGETGGVHFRFKSEREWYTPAGTLRGAASASNHTARIYVMYGTTYFWFEPHSSGNNELKITVRTRGTDTKYVEWKTIAWGFFKENSQTGKYDMNDAWSEVKIARYKCTAVNGDATAANGYWLKVYVTKPGEAFSGAVTAFNAYIPDAMSTADHDYFAIRNSTMGYAADRQYVITEEGYEHHQNFLTIRRGDGAIKATVDEEVYKDVAEYTAENKTLAESFTMGHEPEIIKSGFIGYRNHEEFINVTSGSAFGLEFRTKHLDGGTKVKSYAVNGVAHHFMNLNVGTTGIYVNLDVTVGRLHFDVYTNLPSAEGGERPTAYTGAYDSNRSSAFAYDTTAEYAWRITLVPVKYTDGTTDMNGKGAMMRIYLGKIDPTTGMPASDWAEKPLFQFYNPNARTHTDAKRSGLSIQSTWVEVDDGQHLHEMIFSSNKYVGVKTVVGDQATVNKVSRGGSYTLADTLTDATLIGWSKGAAQYTESDLVSGGTSFTNLNQSATYTAIGLKVTADKKASIRFRQRSIDGRVQPLEISLKWNVKVEFVGDTENYFGGSTLGYKLYASNDSSVEQTVSNVSNNGAGKYSYSIIQSNIPEADYTMKFTCQGYVELNGVKYYSEAVDMNEYGRSVDFVADAAANDLKDVSTNGTFVDGVAYKNAIVGAGGQVIGYHYLTQAQYDLIAAVSAKN